MRQLGRIPHRGHLHWAEAGVDGVAVDLYLMRVLAVDRVVTEQMRVGLGRAEVVERHDFDVLPAGLDDRAQYQASDAPEPVDGHTYRHVPNSAYPLCRLVTASATAPAVVPKFV